MANIIALAAPSAVLAASGGINMGLFAPVGLTTSTGSPSVNGASLSAPSPTLVSYVGANIKLAAPSPTLVATGTFTVLGTAALAAPTPTLSASGTVSGTGQFALTAPSPTLIGYSGAVVSITLTGSPTVAVSGTSGALGTTAITCPLFQLSASGSAQNRGSANLIAPSGRLGATLQAYLVAPMGQLTAIGTATVTATYEAYAVNLKHKPHQAGQEAPIDEVTHYTNFPFTHIVRHQNSYFGVAADGLYLLEGPVDVATPIPWAFKTAITDFGTPVQKTISDMVFGGRLGPATAITVQPGENTSVSYSYTTPHNAHAQNYRKAPGKGMKARYYALGASGTGTLELDSIELDVHNLTRRI